MVAVTVPAAPAAAVGPVGPVGLGAGTCAGTSGPYAGGLRLGRQQPEVLFDASTAIAVVAAPDGTLELIIVREHPWAGTRAQLYSLQQKQQTYVTYALDGQMEQAHPEAAGRPWRIAVSSRAGEPEPRSRSVVDAIAGVLPEHGGSLLMRTA